MTMKERLGASLPSGRYQTCGPAILVQRSNQLSYRKTVVERYITTSSCTNTLELDDGLSVAQLLTDYNKNIKDIVVQEEAIHFLPQPL